MKTHRIVLVLSPLGLVVRGLALPQVAVDALHLDLLTTRAVDARHVRGLTSVEATVLGLLHVKRQIAHLPRGEARGWLDVVAAVAFDPAVCQSGLMISMGAILTCLELARCELVRCACCSS